MNEEPGQADDVPTSQDAHLSRLELLTDVVIFQAKLIADGLRDLLLSPISIIAAILGLVAGGDRPDQYYRKVIRFGRRTEVWIDLFDEHRGPGTAVDLVAPVRSRVIQEAQANPWLSKAGTHLNRQLDEVNSALAPGGRRAPAAQPPDHQGSQGRADRAQDGNPSRSD